MAASGAPPEDHWLRQTYRDPPPGPLGARAARAALPMVASALAVALFLFFMRGLDRYSARCHQLCYDGPFRTRVDGQHWTFYEGAWQWDAQQVVVGLAFAISLYGVWMAGRHRWRRAAGASALAGLLGAAWLAWVLESPTPRDAIG
jgi:hypothetical protein